MCYNLTAMLLLVGGDLKVFTLFILFQISRCVLQLHGTLVFNDRQSESICISTVWTK